MTERGRGPDVRVPPPLIFAAAFLAGWLVDRYVVHAWPSLAPRTARGVMLIGVALVIAGLSLSYWGLATFRRHRTAVIPNRDASTLVVAGPYRFSRNPMYTGMITAFVGGCAVMESLWPLVALPFAIATLYALVIRREERYLATAFGDEYLEYRRHVGRWLTL